MVAFYNIKFQLSLKTDTYFITDITTAAFKTVVLWKVNAIYAFIFSKLLWHHDMVKHDLRVKSYQLWADSLKARVESLKHRLCLKALDEI